MPLTICIYLFGFCTLVCPSCSLKAHHSIPTAAFSRSPMLCGRPERVSTCMQKTIFFCLLGIILYVNSFLFQAPLHLAKQFQWDIEQYQHHGDQSFIQNSRSPGLASQRHITVSLQCHYSVRIQPCWGPDYPTCSLNPTPQILKPMHPWDDRTGKLA